MRGHCQPSLRGCQGFSLVEVVFVMVILGIIASIGSSFIMTAVDGYQATKGRVQLANRGRLALEQMALQLRLAVPNSVRVSETGNCVEFMPIAAAGQYQGALADPENKLSESSSLSAVPFNIDFGTPAHVVVAPYFSSEIYASSSPSAIVGVGSLGAEPITEVSFAGSHRFMRNSVSKRFYLAASPVRFCLSGDQLLTFLEYGLDTASLGDGNPGGRSALMADKVSAVDRAFRLYPGSEVRNAAVLIQLRFSDNGERLELTQEVFIRNVP